VTELQKMIRDMRVLLQASMNEQVAGNWAIAMDKLELAEPLAFQIKVKIDEITKRYHELVQWEAVARDYMTLADEDARQEKFRVMRESIRMLRDHAIELRLDNFGDPDAVAWDNASNAITSKLRDEMRS
jgi:hypothetical protein